MQTMHDYPALRAHGPLDGILMGVGANQATLRRRLTRAEISPVRVTDDALEWYGYGNCHILAGALNEVSGWPLAVVGRFDAGGRLEEVSHVGVLVPDGRFLDIAGARNPAEVLRQYFAYGKPDAVREVTLEFLVEIGQYRDMDGWRTYCRGQEPLELVHCLASTLVRSARH